MERMDDLQAWEYELKIKQILSKLGIHNLESQISHFIGGAAETGGHGAGIN